MATPADARLSLDGSHRVLTPEYVEFDFVLAGILSRFLAWLIDTFVALAFAFAVMMVLSFVMAVFPGFGSAMAAVVWFAVDWGYFIFFETIWSGQTIGKKLLGLRVIQESGVRIGFYQSVLRNLARPVDRFPWIPAGGAFIPIGFYGVGALSAFMSGSQQRLGDLLAGTIVVRERRLKIPSSLARPEGDTAIFNDSDFRARVGKLTAEEEAVLFSAALRREELGMEARLNLFATLSTRLQDEHGFQKPAHLSDEKLVLLVTAAVAARNAEAKKKAPPPPKRRFLVR
jgi:uncharacterized RDD family membrane protein YckC